MHNKRYYAAVVFPVLLIIACGSVQISSDTRVISVPGMSKSQIYQKAKQWLSYKFVFGKAVIDYQDRGTGRLIAKGEVTTIQPMGGKVDVFMVATIDCAPGKTRILVEPAECSVKAPNGAVWPCTAAYLSSGAREDMVLKPREFVEDYEAYMTGGRAPAWLRAAGLPRPVGSSPAYPLSPVIASHN